MRSPSGGPAQPAPAAPPFQVAIELAVVRRAVLAAAIFFEAAVFFKFVNLVLFIIERLRRCCVGEQQKTRCMRARGKVGCARGQVRLGPICDSAPLHDGACCSIGHQQQQQQQRC